MKTKTVYVTQRVTEIDLLEYEVPVNWTNEEIIKNIDEAEIVHTSTLDNTYDILTPEQNYGNATYKMYVGKDNYDKDNPIYTNEIKD